MDDRTALDKSDIALLRVLEADARVSFAELGERVGLSKSPSWARVRALEEESRAGIALLHPSSQPCIEAARILYCGIVDAVEEIDYEVFTRRATVSQRRRLAVALPAWNQARRARKKYGEGHPHGLHSPASA